MKTLSLKLILITLTLLSLSQVKYVQSKELKIHVNDDVIEDVFSQLKDFGQEYIKTTGPERAELMKQVADAWKNTAAKIILNFGKTVAPVVSNWAELMREVQVNDDCDQDCAVKCLNPRARDTMFFDQECLNQCKCKFNIFSMDKAKYGKIQKELAENAQNASKFMNEIMSQNQQKVKPALDKYLKKESELHDEFAKMLEKVATETFECDKQCINDCLNKDFVTFWEIPQCVRHCNCKQHLIEIEGGAFNIPQLMLYNEYDPQAWSTLKLYQHEIK